MEDAVATPEEELLEILAGFNSPCESEVELSTPQ